MLGYFFIPTAIHLKTIRDASDGVLYIGEGTKEIPFQIKRVYVIDEVNKNSLRGFHAHKKLEQIMFCLRGSCEMEMYDGKNPTIEIMKNPEKGIHIKPLVWHSLRKFSKDCLLMVLASDFYDEADYIRDFNEFKKLI